MVAGQKTGQQVQASIEEGRLELVIRKLVNRLEMQDRSQDSQDSQDAEVLCVKVVFILRA